jgi:hypothetical protein
MGSPRIASIWTRPRLHGQSRLPAAILIAAGTRDALLLVGGWTAAPVMRAWKTRWDGPSSRVGRAPAVDPGYRVCLSALTGPQPAHGSFLT